MYASTSLKRPRTLFRALSLKYAFTFQLPVSDNLTDKRAELDIKVW